MKKNKRTGKFMSEGKPGTKRSSGGKKLTQWQRRNIVAWDGEGVTVDNQGTHLYTLLSNSKGDWIANPSGLPSRAVFDFLIDHSSIKNDDINVIFGGSYDVNMMLKDLPREKIECLWNTGKCIWDRYKILYTPRKKFSVQRIEYDSATRVITKSHVFVLWDVIGFFQSSFVKACYKWLGDHPALAEIQRMKNLRSNFNKVSFDEILEYNTKENLLLVMIMKLLFEAMDEAHIRPSRYDGAGALASALLGQNKVRDHYGTIPIPIQKLAQYAYSGGRIEAVKIGNHVCDPPTNPNVWRYDINSAYPAAMREIRSYEGATWTIQEYGPKDDWGTFEDDDLVSLSWDIREPQHFYPLWYREANGTILYPRSGNGTYYGVEAKLLIDYFPPDDYVIHSIARCHRPKDAPRPFAFIDGVYKQRKIFKQQGSHAEEALKLGMNAMYGKLAQRVGWHGDTTDGRNNGSIPPYHHLLMAGFITASTRARLYSYAQERSSAVIAFATDAIITDGRLYYPPVSTELGEWSEERMGGITIVQPGIYWLLSDGEWQAKYRGFDPGSLVREEIIQCWKEGLTTYPATSTRFVGMGSALMSTDFLGNWAHWLTTDRELTLLPTGKRKAGQDLLRDISCLSTGLRDTIPVEPSDYEASSAKHPVSWLDNDTNPYDHEVALMKLIDKELQDTEYS